MNPLYILSFASLASAFRVGGSGSTFLEQRIPNSCSTTTSSSCIFPFTYKGTTHYQCTYADSPTPWCATAVDSTGGVVTNSWGDCVVSATSGCTTESITPGTTTPTPGSGSSCTPGTIFVQDCNTCVCNSLGQSVCTTNTCTTTTTPAPGPGSCTPGTTFLQDCNTCVCNSLGQSVCTTNTCTTTTTTPAPLSCSTVSGPATGQACVFPFTYAGTTFTTCAEWIYGGVNQGKFWCSTKVDATGTHVNGEGNYGFCSAGCSSAPKSEFAPLRSAANPGAVVFGGASKPAGSRPF